eukprot:TRINITY_DN4460_c0_g1_i3.p1 TRINITY_DN4460_c0_g1~~TRINITY_DN4460_c0_g1_i3.p1  ORF type:complete len:127 (+),score=13.61 TRINITY_DN4460_c0_g1_i3:390-770(+)
MQASLYNRNSRLDAYRAKIFTSTCENAPKKTSLLSFLKQVTIKFKNPNTKYSSDSYSYITRKTNRKLNNEGRFCSERLWMESNKGSFLRPECRVKIYNRKLATKLRFFKSSLKSVTLVPATNRISR